MSIKATLWLIPLFLTVSLLGQEDTASSNENANQLIKQAEDLVNEGLVDSALVVYEDARLILLQEEKWDEYFEVVNKIGERLNEKTDHEAISFLNTQIELAKKEEFHNKEILGNIYYRLGDAYRLNADYENTKMGYEKALSNYEAIELADNSELLYLYSSVGTAYLENGDWKQAESFFKKAITGGLERKEQGKEYEAIIIHAYNGLGILNKEIYQLDKAIEYQKKAMQILEKSNEDIINLGISYYSLGYSYQVDNQIDKSLSYLHRADKIFNQEFGETHPFVLATYNLLATSYGTTNKEEEFRYLEKSLQICKSLYEEDHVRTGISMHALGEALIERRELNKGLAYLLKTQQIYDDLLPEYHLSKASSLISLSSFYTHNRPNVDSAYIYLEELFNQYTNLFDQNYSQLAEYHYRKSEWAILKKDYLLATQEIKRAIDLNTWEDKKDTKIQIDNIENQFISQRIANRSYIIFAKKSYEEWKRNKLSKSLISDCLKYLEYSQMLYLNEAQKGGKYDLGYSPIFYALQYSSDFYANSGSQSDFESFFKWSERLKGQSLSKTINEIKAQEIAGVDPGILEKEEFYSKRLFQKENELFATIENDDSLNIATIRNEMWALVLEKNELVQKIEQEYPRYFEIKYGGTPITVKKTIKLLKENEIILDFVLDDYKNFAYCLSIDKKNQELHKFSINKELFADISTLNKLLQSSSLIRTDQRSKFVELSNKLYNQLILPIEDQLVDKKRIVIIGDGMTHYLPFDVLLKSRELKPYHELNYLVNDFEISYHYSVSLFAQSREKEIEKSEGMLAFAPVFNDELSTTYALETIQGSVNDSLSSTYRAVDADGNFVPLTYSLAEVNAITKMVNKKSKQKSELLLFDEANESNLKEKLEQAHRFVHIASHSFANLRESKFSGIACAPPVDSTATEDGTLYVGEIYNLDVKADLAVLSSCESGLGKLQTGEGLIGLNRSFIYSGVPNVVFSLWKVNDKFTSELMIEFYKQILEGEDYAGALRKAKLSLIKNETTAFPSVWSSFLLIGR